MFYKKVKITQEAFNKLNSISRRRSKPKVLLLGENSKGVIEKSIELKYIPMCEDFPKIRSEDLTKGSVKLYKEKLIPCGIARIGDHCRGGTFRTGLLGGLGFPQGVLITFGLRKSPYAYRCHSDRTQKSVEIIITNKTRKEEK